MFLEKLEDAARVLQRFVAVRLAAGNGVVAEAGCECVGGAAHQAVAVHAVIGAAGVVSRPPRLPARAALALRRRLLDRLVRSRIPSGRLGSFVTQWPFAAVVGALLVIVAAENAAKVFGALKPFIDDRGGVGVMQARIP